jgi:mRNA interferase MazF
VRGEPAVEPPLDVEVQPALEPQDLPGMPGRPRLPAGAVQPGDHHVHPEDQQPDAQLAPQRRPDGAEPAMGCRLGSDNWPSTGRGGRTHAIYLAPAADTGASRPPTRQRHLGCRGVQGTTFLIDQIRSIDTDYIVGDPVHYLDRDELDQIEHAVTRYLGL